ncbi:MAG: CRISPR-associated protein [Paludibacteraceae bacterium]|nr:CRISPR-associated protein [Paludibacteraceae bacterium]
MLINLSNHPSTQWSEKQKKASVIYGEILDLPFPIVDETADEAYIRMLAEKYLQIILEIAKTERVVVHVMGELTFTFLLVSFLLKNDIKCMASTTKRIVKEDKAKKEVVFCFEKFRNYEIE